MSTFYNEQTGKYENFEKIVVDRLAYIRGAITAQQAESEEDDTEEEEAET